jgi:hypothetical protein
LPRLKDDSPSRIARLLGPPRRKRKTGDTKEHHGDIAEPTAPASSAAPEFGLPFEVSLKLLAAPGRRIPCVIHGWVTSYFGRANHSDCSQSGIVESTTVCRSTLDTRPI